MLGQKASITLVKGVRFIATCFIFLPSISSADKFTKIRAVSEESGTEDVLYFGWFLNETTATSLHTYSKNMFKQILNEIPEVRDYIQEFDDQDDPLNYFVKPLDPSSGESDPFFHITAKYCGGENCIEYYNKVKESLGKLFETNLIGFFFTKDTYGVRVNLTSVQEELFAMDEEDGGGDIADVITSLMGGRTNEYPGMQFVPQLINYKPSQSRAHVTLGCARGIPAVQTGFDLLNIIDYEVNYLSHVDYLMQNYGMLRIFQTEDSLNKTFVLYTSDKLIVDGTFKGYEGAKNRAINIFCPSLISIFLFSWFVSFSL